jgi:hypothetical protein
MSKVSEKRYIPWLQAMMLGVSLFSARLTAALVVFRAP